MINKTCLFSVAAWLLGATFLQAQGTSFTYQGRLKESGNPANGSYDLRFVIWDAPSAGNCLDVIVTNAATSVSNGLFTVTLDFGSVFDGNARWLEIGVRTNGGSTFITLTPRQALTAAPYAIYAGGVKASGISGTITSNMLAPGTAAANLAASGQSPVTGGGMILSSNPTATNLTSAGYTRFGGQLDLSWQEIAAAAPPTARLNQTALWTGSKMIIWGGNPCDNIYAIFSTGCIYDPVHNTWTSITTNGAPIARTGCSVTWCGNEMIVWGGKAGDYVNDGARYIPATDSWIPMTTNNAPTARGWANALWTGDELILWGGVGSGESYLDTGARYNPMTDTWVTISTSNAPTPRISCSKVWTGSEFVVWGGVLGTTVWGDGARYNPSNDVWLPMSTNAAPLARGSQSTVWTGSEMIIWGGQLWGWATTNTGARYNPQTDSWSPVANEGSPVQRYSHSAVWSGNEMIVWGGTGIVTPFLNTGGRYNPVLNKWTPMAISGAPTGRQGHSCVWSGSEMIVFGGYSNSICFDDTFSYAPDRVMYLYLRK